jgi:hypothetical protein
VQGLLLLLLLLLLRCQAQLPVFPVAAWHARLVF